MSNEAEKCGGKPGAPGLIGLTDYYEGTRRCPGCPDCTAPAKKCPWPAHRDCTCVGCLDGWPLGSGRYHFSGTNTTNCENARARSSELEWRDRYDRVAEGGGTANDEIDRLTKENEALRRKGESDLREKLAEYKAKGIAAEMERNEARTALAEAERQRDEAGAALDMLTQALRAAATQRDAAQKALEEARGEIVFNVKRCLALESALSAAREEAKGVRERTIAECIQAYYDAPGDPDLAMRALLQQNKET